jgi:phytol kinase
MPSPWLGIVLVIVVLAGVMAGLKYFGKRFGLHPETSRKGVHIVMGLVTLSLPWLFRESWPVLLLTLLAVAGMAGIRLLKPLKERFGGVLNGVERRSLGEVYFPLAVAALFLLAKGNLLLYVIPLLTLTLADAVAAMVGIRYGRYRYATSEGSKSAEGSLAFFTVAFLSALVPLLLMSDTGRAESLLIALLLGLLVMLFEAVSVGGVDNLFIPIGCYALLRRYLAMSEEELLFRLGAIVLLALLVFLWRRRTTLKGSALLAAALVGYMNWVLGGWQWLTVSLVLFLTYTRLWPVTDENSRPVHTVRAVAAVAFPGMAWLLAAMETGKGGYFYPFIVSYAAYSVIIGMLQTGYARPLLFARQRFMQVLPRSWFVFLPLFFLPAAGRVSSGDVMQGLSAAIVALPLLAVAGALFLRFGPALGNDEGGKRRWFGYALIAFAASFLSAVIPLLDGRLR